MAIFWSATCLVGVSPVVLVVVLTDPLWFRNVPFLLFVIIPGVGGALLFGPAWYYRRRKLMQQEFRASQRASESRYPTRP